MLHELRRDLPPGRRQRPIYPAAAAAAPQQMVRPEVPLSLSRPQLRCELALRGAVAAGMGELPELHEELQPHAAVPREGPVPGHRLVQPGEPAEGVDLAVVAVADGGRRRALSLPRAAAARREASVDVEHPLVHPRGQVQGQDRAVCGRLRLDAALQHGRVHPVYFVNHCRGRAAAEERVVRASGRATLRALQHAAHARGGQVVPQRPLPWRDVPVDLSQVLPERAVPPDAARPQAPQRRGPPSCRPCRAAPAGRGPPPGNGRSVPARHPPRWNSRERAEGSLHGSSVSSTFNCSLLHARRPATINAHRSRQSMAPPTAIAAAVGDADGRPGTGAREGERASPRLGTI